MMNRKGQAAMEFLMTYGWAILVVLAAIGALAYFGVLSPSNFVPDKCTGQGFTCADFTVSEANGIDLYISNNMGFPTVNVTMSLTDASSNECCDSGDVCGIDADYANGQQETVEFTGSLCGLTEGARFQGALVVTYTNANTGVEHTTTGDVSGRVSP